MKILMINSVCGIRSTGRICTDLASDLEKKGHEVKIAYGRANVPEKYQHFAVKIGSDLDVIAHGVTARMFDGSGFGSRYATKRFINWVKEYDPDVIHLHNIHGYYINIEMLFSYLKDCGKPIVWTLHDSWALTGHSPYCDVYSCKKWKTGCHDCPAIRNYPKSYLDRSRSNWERKRKLTQDIPGLNIVTPSQWLADIVRESFLGQYPVTVIHNGIDTRKFSFRKGSFRKENNLEDKFILLGVASAWDEMKGVNDFIELSKRLDENCKLVIVGISGRQKELFPENVLTIERTDSVEQLAEIYSSADLFLNLSHCENYPTVNLEAQACGLAVLTYDVGGSRETIVDKRGFVVEKGNIGKVADIISSLSKAKATGKEDHEIDLSAIDTEHFIKQYEELFESVCSSKTTNQVKNNNK